MVSLCAFSDQLEAGDQAKTIPFTYRDYLALLDWMGRPVRLDKRGSIPKHLQPISQQLGQRWVKGVSGLMSSGFCCGNFRGF